MEMSLNYSNRALQLRFLSFKSLQPHRETVFDNGFWHIPDGARILDSPVHISVSESLILISCTITREWPNVDPVHLVTIVNWRTGATERIFAYLPWRISTTCVIAKRYLLIGGHRDGTPSMDVFHIGDTADITSPQSPLHLSTFEFPEPNTAVRRGSLKSISLTESGPCSIGSPGGGDESDFDGRCACDVNEEFHDDFLCRLLVMQVSYPRRDNQDRTGHHEIIAPLRVFIPRSHDEDAMHVVCSWAAWGPRNTRWFANVHDRSKNPIWLRSDAWGPRLARGNALLDFNTYDIMRENLRDPPQPNASSFSFRPFSTPHPFSYAPNFSSASISFPSPTPFRQPLNPPLFSLTHSAANLTGGSPAIVTTPTIIRAIDGYLEDIVSYLPYRTTPFDVILTHRALVLKENVILGIKTDRHGIYQVDAFKIFDDVPT
ncbi:hypothetical protein HGRIS_010362 [Hohenbuehelia grisea]|uniref:Uncharacterized protein n=1 Tax=Hohenbuehelia grisea TaxID=104357 RepID=A0ABR3J436_9AGAR